MTSRVSAVIPHTTRGRWLLLAASAFLLTTATIASVAMLLDRGSVALLGGAANGSLGDPMAIDVQARQPNEYAIVYARPGADARLDRTVYLRTASAQDPANSREVDLGRFTGVEMAPSNSPVVATQPRVSVIDVSGHGYLFQLAEAGPLKADEFQRASLPRAVSVGNTAFRQEGSEIVGRDAYGRVLAAYPVPRPLPPAPNDPVLRTTAVIRDPTQGTASAVVPTPDGHLLALIEGISNSLAVDLQTGETVDLLGYTRIQTATLAENGFLYAVAGKRSPEGSDFHILKLGRAPLRLVADQPLGYRSVLNGRSLLATPDGQLFAYLPSFDGASLMYKVDPATAATTLVPLPRALGRNATVGVDGKIYFFAGHAENRVSIYDPTTGALEQDVPWLRAPEGTYVEGVVVR